MGLVYWNGGDLLMPIILSIVLIALVLCCVLVMCKAKATRMKNLGTLGQLIFGLLVFVVLLLASKPFTNFLRVISDSENIISFMTDACNAAENLDNSYVHYAQQRISDYRDNLYLISSGKYINPSKYEECFGNASGNTDDAKINGLVKSLQRRLLPDSESIVQERHRWLSRAKNESVWNPLTPSNLNKVEKEVKEWTKNYEELSSVVYKGESASVFKYEKFNNSLKTLTDTYKTFQKPTFKSIIASITCFIIMLLPYLMTRSSLASATSRRNKETNIYE